jgi:CHAT domain-containing protein
MAVMIDTGRRWPTAADDKPGAEALSGLARAFFYAGARSLIVSHWEVDDQVTAQLMINAFQASARDATLKRCVKQCYDDR